MYHVERMSPEDFEFAVCITDTMGWELVNGDFQFMLKLEPEGCFVLFHNSERIGVATTISFGKVGWIGNVIVSKSYRRKRVGALLMKHCLSYLTSRNVETVGLYSYLNTVPFYKRLGFKYDSDFIVLRGKGFSSSVDANLKEARKGDIQALVDYDASCFGASRKKLLELLLKPDNLCYMFVEDKRILGYGMAKVYEGFAELGSFVCQRGRNDVATSIFRTILNRLKGFEVSLCIPEKENAILQMLLMSGFSEKFRVTRMFFGSSAVNDCIYVAESLERG